MSGIIIFYSFIGVIFLSWVCGYCLTKLGNRIPDLLGMLFGGCLLANTIPSNYFDIPTLPSSVLRTIALSVILIRAGFGLDIKALQKKTGPTLGLAFLPCTIEAITEAIVSKFVLGFPWGFCFALGFVLCAVSLAVVVPSLLVLQDQKYGTNKGIPTMILAASSFDNIVALTAFSLSSNSALTSAGVSGGNTSLAWQITRAPVQIILGILIGFIFGYGLFFFLRFLVGLKQRHQTEKSSKYMHYIDYAILTVPLLGIGLMMIFLGQKYSVNGGGYLGAMTTSSILGKLINESDEITYCGNVANLANVVDGNALKLIKTLTSQMLRMIWTVFQPILFGLIGAQIIISNINPSLVGKGVIVLICGVIVRFLVTNLAVYRSDLNFWEKMFVAVAWFPKATVQAAIGSVIYDIAVQANANETVIGYGQDILTISVLSIILTAPFGALGIMLTGPKWLTKESEFDEKENLQKEEIINDAESLNSLELQVVEQEIKTSN